jgi:ParB family chromosome partitioning protein
MAKPALGRGLGALLGGTSPSAKPVLPSAAYPTTTTVTAAPPVDDRERVQRVPLDRVQPCPFQPRKDFTPESLQELADSIKEQGIIQPLIVRRKGDRFELIAGERRWRAAQLASLTEVPVILREADDREVLELALIENLQRENLNPIEEALGYSELISAHQMRQEDVAVKVGKSRTVVANALRLLKLPVELQTYLRDSRLSVGHAKVQEGLNVRQTEELVTRLQQPAVEVPAHTRNGATVPALRDVHVTNLENKLRERLGTKVQLRYRAGKGALDIRFYSDDELERIMQILGVSVD